MSNYKRSTKSTHGILEAICNVGGLFKNLPTREVKMTNTKTGKENYGSGWTNSEATRNAMRKFK